jgi:hypothetical protein
MNNSTQSFEREWALRLVGGCIEASVLGKTSLEVVKGRIRRVVERYSVSSNEVKIITDIII